MCSAGFSISAGKRKEKRKEKTRRKTQKRHVVGFLWQTDRETDGGVWDFFFFRGKKSRRGRKHTNTQVISMTSTAMEAPAPDSEPKTLLWYVLFKNSTCLSGYLHPGNRREWGWKGKTSRATATSWRWWDGGRKSAPPRWCAASCSGQDADLPWCQSSWETQSKWEGQRNEDALERCGCESLEVMENETAERLLH